MQGAWKSKSMGWIFMDASFSYKTHQFDSLEKALQFCKMQGLSYHVEVPKDKKMEFKSYSHNFLWKGEPEVDSEDLED